MKATLGTLPTDDDRWAYEIKWDGYRTLVHLADGRIRLQSSSGLDVSERWPELQAMATAINAESAILDGELVVLGDDGRPSFGLLQQGARPAVFQAFDVLAISGHDTTPLPYEQRRALLTQLVEPGPNWQVPSHRIGGGADLVAATAAAGLEGVIAKRLGSVYRPGTRTTDWRKLKNRRRIDVVIGGFTAGTGARANTFGALLVGFPEGDALRFAGGVGTGFTQARLVSLRAVLDELRRDICPFEPIPPASVVRNATWVAPDLRATVEIAEITNDGSVRHASFVGLADDQ